MQSTVFNPVLFIILKDDCGKRTQRETDGIILGYDNGLTLVIEMKRALHYFVAAWDKVLMARRMKVSRENTEVNLVGREHEEMHIVLGKEVLKQVDHFKNLGVCFGTSNDVTLDLNFKIPPLHHSPAHKHIQTSITLC